MDNIVYGAPEVTAFEPGRVNKIGEINQKPNFDPTEVEPEPAPESALEQEEKTEDPEESIPVKVPQWVLRKNCASDNF